MTTTTQQELWTKDTWDTSSKEKKAVPPISQPPPEELDTYGPKKPKAKDGKVSTFEVEIKEPVPKMTQKDKNAAKRKEAPKKRSWGSDCESDSE